MRSSLYTGCAAAGASRAHRAPCRLLGRTAVLSVLQLRVSSEGSRLAVVDGSFTAGARLCARRASLASQSSACTYESSRLLQLNAHDGSSKASRQRLVRSAGRCVGQRPRRLSFAASFAGSSSSPCISPRSAPAPGGPSTARPTQRPTQLRIELSRPRTAVLRAKGRGRCAHPDDGRRSAAAVQRPGGLGLHSVVRREAVVRVGTQVRDDARKERPEAGARGP